MDASEKTLVYILSLHDALPIYLLLEIEGALKLKKSRPLPAGPLSHTATVKFTISVSPNTWPVPSNSAPLVGSLQALELVRNAVIPVPGIVGPTSSVSGKV